MFGRKDQEFTVDEILHTYSETIQKLEAREATLAEAELKLRNERDELDDAIEAVDTEAKRGVKALNFLGRMFEVMDED